MSPKPVPRPFLKRAGGKTQVADLLVSCMPPTFTVYHEPFVGGGALFFRLYREQRVRRSILSDLNAELIDTYVAIRDAVTDVMRLLAEFPHAEAFYYNLRAKHLWQLSLPERAAVSIGSIGRDNLMSPSGDPHHRSTLTKRICFDRSILVGIPTGYLHLCPGYT